MLSFAILSDLTFGTTIKLGVMRETPTKLHCQLVQTAVHPKERDNETGLDYFLGRYYSNVEGRFISIDADGPNHTNPQTFNKYQYSLNNPVQFIDPDGRQAQEIATLTPRRLRLSSKAKKLRPTRKPLSCTRGAVRSTQCV